jgi:hypothetical protein
MRMRLNDHACVMEMDTARLRGYNHLFEDVAFHGQPTTH